MESSASSARDTDSSSDLPPEAQQRRQLALRHVRQYPDPVLRRTAVEVTEFDDELAALADRMISIMHDAYGVGLAGPQLGLLMRIFVFQAYDDEPAEAVINPVIEWTSDETDVDFEGCLSLGEVSVPVRRPTSIKVRAQTLDGDEKLWQLDGFPARVFQHEIDHLDGRMIIDSREDPEARRAAMAQLRPRP